MEQQLTCKKCGASLIEIANYCEACIDEIIKVKMEAQPPRFVCDLCGEGLLAAQSFSSWRFNGENWEHRCADHHPQAGHMGMAIPRWDYERIQELEAEVELINTKRDMLQAENDLLKSYIRQPFKHAHSPLVNALISSVLAEPEQPDSEESLL
jgi:hypothetical protein